MVRNDKHNTKKMLNPEEVKEIVEEPKQKSWNELTKEEKEEFFKRLNAEVKVKFVSGEIIGFNPFKVCASMPAQYNIKNYTTGKKMEFRWEHDVRRDIANNAIESNNIKYLEEAKFDVKNIKLNLEL